MYFDNLYLKNMKTVKIIKAIIDGAGILIIVLVSLGIVGFVTLPEGYSSGISEPYWEITSAELREELNSLLPQTDDPLTLEITSAQMNIPINLGIRVFMIAFILILGAYMAYILEVFRQIIKDVRNNSPFNIKNIRRVKRIGILITTAPIIEWALLTLLSVWFDSRYQFEGLKLAANNNLGWPVLILGLLIIVLGMAFEQGKKMQDENEMTI